MYNSGVILGVTTKLSEENMSFLCPFYFRTWSTDQCPSIWFSACFFFFPLNSCVCLKMSQTEPHLATGYLGNVSLLEKGGCQKPPAMVVKGLCLVTQSCPTLCDPMDCSLPGSFVHGDSPGKNTRVGCHALLQGIFQTQWSNSGLPHCRQILYHLSYEGSPNKDLDDLNGAIQQLDLTDSHRHCIQQQWNTYSSQVHMEHSPT